MTTQDLNAATLAAINSPKLLAEMEYHLEIDDDEGRPRDHYQALLDAEDAAAENRERAVLAAARKALIELGTYRQVTAEELARSTTLRGDRQRPIRPDFRLGGVAYRFDKHPGRTA